jgi:hypothetical protein
MSVLVAGGLILADWQRVTTVQLATTGQSVTPDMCMEKGSPEEIVAQARVFTFFPSFEFMAVFRNDSNHR